MSKRSEEKAAKAKKAAERFAGRMEQQQSLPGIGGLGNPGELTLRQEDADIKAEAESAEAELAEAASTRDIEYDEQVFVWAADGVRFIRCPNCDYVFHAADWHVAMRLVCTHFNNTHNPTEVKS